MKDDVADQVARAIPAVAGMGVTWSLQDVSLLMSIIVGLATVVYVLAQLAFLLRRWWKLEFAKTTNPLDIPAKPRWED